MLLSFLLLLSNPPPPPNLYAAGQPGPSRVVAPPPAPSRSLSVPAIRIANRSEPWPARAATEPISHPDWSDYRLYPQAALDLDQQGRVTVEALVGIDGVPRACRLLHSSGYAELDAGTCNLMTLLRFQPARDADGRPAEAVYRRSFYWLTSDPTPFGPTGLIARLSLNHGQVSTCTLESEGVVPPEWTKLACRNITNDSDYYLGDRRHTAKRATVAIQVVPAGMAGPETAKTRPIAEWRSEFRLAPNGDIQDCRKLVDRGFGPVTENQQSPCGFFLTRTWFQPGGAEASGLFQLRVYIDR